MKSYDYVHRQGVRPISWEEFATLAAQLAEALEQAGVEMIVFQPSLCSSLMNS